MKLEQLDVPASILGEGPVWSDRDGCLYYVDIFAYRVVAYYPGARRYETFQFDSYVSCLAECQSGGLIVALFDRLIHFDPRKGVSSAQTFVSLEQDRPENRLNDGKADPYGRFWVGSMRLDQGGPEGRLWCVLPDGHAKVVRDGIMCSNSTAFDAARSRMYFADSNTGQIEVANFDASRELGPFRPFSKTAGGDPDGSCTDAAGYLWNAEWGGSRIRRYSPDGSVERVIETPVTRPSCCTFGGENHRTLFVTSAQYGMSDQEKQQDPQAGALFAIELDVEGRPADLFGM